MGLGRLECCDEELTGPGELGHLPHLLEVFLNVDAIIFTEEELAGLKACGLLASANCYLVTKGPRFKPWPRSSGNRL